MKHALACRAELFANCVAMPGFQTDLHKRWPCARSATTVDLGNGVSAKYGGLPAA
jgi:hypothetical protein